MKSICLFIVALFATSLVYSQGAKSVYFELGGPGLASLNYDMRFGHKEDGLGGRIGVGGFSIDGDGAVFVPVGLNYLIGKDQKNYFELGAGVTPVFISSKSSDGTTTTNDNFTSTFGYLNFGYRLQPAHGGFTFRAFITPVFGEWGFFPYWGGVSFGYKFGGKK